MRKIAWTPDAWNDYLYWESDNKTRKKLNNIIKEIMRNPIDGKGKPEPLKGNYSGYWSRRVNDKDRIVYSFTDEAIIIYACRGHYDDK
ncbi:Txe/YoeB family addiction module toxin [Gardnerella greenwoodii]|uniref:Endoribonuclease YoeB n=1 Tax=Gardnerella greenwoodii 00703Dmash TaxID=698960 RepID=I4M8Y4_9BIFI|nr:Txe/YoeB family addiction module toxin [Gardnerella greenwoodii]EIK85674.1 toxin of the YoeB-YefM toxin-antitoxin system [Gardnerella greenwoodii 00703Dmash]